MKFPKTILITTLKSIVMLCFITSLTSCSSDDDDGSDEANNTPLPTEFVKTYIGSISYENNSGSIDILDSSDGTATISGSASNYTITFNNDIPSLSNIRFNLINGQYFHVVVGTTSDPDESVIINDTPRLRIVIERNGDTWIFNGI